MTRLFGILGALFLATIITTGCTHTEVVSENEVIGAEEPQKEMTAESLFGSEVEAVVAEADKPDAANPAVEELPKDEPKVAEAENSAVDTAFAPAEKVAESKVEEAKEPVENAPESVVETPAPVDASQLVLADNSTAETPTTSAAATVEEASESAETENQVKEAPLVEKSIQVQKTVPKKRRELTTQPKTKQGVVLNRFYYLRAGDNPNRVSELLYGDASRQKDLVKWNSGEWEPGKMIWYNSPLDPVDAKSGSFYGERGLKPEEYVVKKGDQLSSIAGEKYGDVGSWREIAGMNHLSKGSPLKEGQRLLLMPSQMGKLAKEVISVPVERSTAALPAPIVAKVPAVQPQLASTEVAKVAQSRGNPRLALWIIMGLGFITLYLFWRRMRKARQYNDIIE